MSRPSLFRRLLRRLRRLIGLLVLALLLAQLAVGAHLYWLRDHAPGSSAFMRAAAAERGQPVTFLWRERDQISPHLARAVIAAEDTRFTQHRGLDWEGMRQAWERNRSQGRAVAGGSTLTQQLIKNLYLSSRRSYLRKGAEAVLAMQAELILDKQRLLTLYLNVVEFAPGIYGAEAAARHFYGISAQDLNAHQSAELAARLPRPAYYAERGRTPWLEQYTRIILRRMPQVQVP